MGAYVRDLTVPSSHDSLAVADNAVYALSQIANWADGAATVVAVGILQMLDKLLQSPIVSLRWQTCVMLENLMGHPSTAVEVQAADPCRRLVALLCQVP